MADQALSQNPQVLDNDNTTTGPARIDILRSSKSKSKEVKLKAPFPYLNSRPVSQQSTKSPSGVIQDCCELSSSNCSVPCCNSVHDERVTQEPTRPSSIVTGVGNRPSYSIISVPPFSNGNDGCASQHSTSPPSISIGVDDELSDITKFDIFFSDVEDKPVFQQSTRPSSVIAECDDDSHSIHSAASFIATELDNLALLEDQAAQPKALRTIQDTQAMWRLIFSSSVDPYMVAGFDSFHSLAYPSVPLSERKTVQDTHAMEQYMRSSFVDPQVGINSFGNGHREPFITSDKPLPEIPTEALPLVDIFSENASKPVIKAAIPRLQQRIEVTQQLVYCNVLLLSDSLSATVAASGDETSGQAVDSLQRLPLDTEELDWLDVVRKDPIEQDRLQLLVIRTVEEFVADANKDFDKIIEVVALGPVLQKNTYRKLLSTFIKEIDDALILDFDMLHGLIQLVQDASPGFLVADDLVKIFSIQRIRLQATHQQSIQHSYHLTLAISRLLDVMADQKVQDLDRVLEHEPLSAVLSGLKDSEDSYLMYQACYAFQALQYVPDEESNLHAVWRHSTSLVGGLAKFPSVVKLDLSAVVDGLVSLYKTVESAVGVASTASEGVCSLKDRGRGALNSLKEGFGSGQKRSWYPAVRAAYAFAQAAQLEDLKQLVFEAPCCRDPLFQWGICQLLGDIASDTAWAVPVRQQAVSLLGHLYKFDEVWGRDESVKTWMLTIMTKLRTTSEQGVNAIAHTLLEDFQHRRRILNQHIYPSRIRLPNPDSSPVLAKAQGIPYLEYDLHKLRVQRLKEVHLPIYTPPMAKANLQARDDDLFPLMDKVQEFLDSDRQVMLILGDSGAGKSTFNKHLELELLSTYKRGGPIPLFINLPAIDRPDRELIAEHLRTNNFSEAQIQEMKQHRQLVLICDGYDESQLTVNLHTSNVFNRAGQWDVKMIISCRTQFLGQEYRTRFMPASSSHYSCQAFDLFQEAVIAPFSKKQIEHYVEQYIPLEPRTWTTKDYMDSLTTIPNLMDLAKNPFLLSLTLEALPGVTKGKINLSAIKITRVQLYDNFVGHWLAVNSRRLQQTVLTREERATLEDLLNAGFVSMGIDYSTRLALAMYEKQEGNPVVQYVHIKDKKSWRADFFGQDPEVRLLRDSSPLTRSGNQYRFLHRSMLEYFFSLAVFNPNYNGNNNGVVAHRDASSSTSQILSADSLLFKRNLLTEPSVIQFLSERAKQLPDFERRLFIIIEQSKIDFTVSTAAANAITILVRAGVRFNSADLRGIRVPGADLSDGQFDHAQFQGADLSGVNLARSWLRQANFSNTQMEGAKFEELPFLEEEVPVDECFYSSDGKLLAVGREDRVYRFYNTSTWAAIREDTEFKVNMLSIALSPNSQQIVSGDWGGRLRLWNVASGDSIFFVERHNLGVLSVVFSPCGMQIASASLDGTVRLWSSKTRDCLFVLKGLKYKPQLMYSPDGQRLSLTSQDGLIRMWDPRTGEPVDDWASTDKGASYLCCSADGQGFASADDDGKIKIQFTIDTARGPGPSVDASNTLTNIAFPSSRQRNTLFKGNVVELWDFSTKLLVSSYSGHDSNINTCALSPNGLQIASGDDAGIVRIWQVNPGRSMADSQELSGGACVVAYSPDGRQILSGSGDGGIHRWESRRGAALHLPLAAEAAVRSLTFVPNGGQIVAGYYLAPIRLLSGQTGVVERTLVGHTHTVDSMATSPCGRWIISASEDQTVRFWDLLKEGDQGEVVDQLYCTAEGALHCVAFSPTGHQFAVGSKFGSVRLYNPRTRCPLSLQTRSAFSPVKTLTFDPRDHKLHSLSYSPNGWYLIFGSKSSTIYILDLQSDNFATELKGHTDDVHQAVFSPCGKWILSGSQDKTVRLWHLQDGNIDSWSCLAVLEEYTQGVTCLAWNPVVPMEVVIGCKGGSIRVWRILIKDTEERPSFRLLWANDSGRLYARHLILNGAVGLSPVNHKLLVQRGAVDDSTSLGGDGLEGSSENE